MRRVAAGLAAVGLAAGAGACGGGEDAPRAGTENPAPSATATATPGAREAPPRPAPPRARERRVPRVDRVRCPAEVTACRSVVGRVVYVERVDPDGDGDLHVVLAGRANVTGPGLTSVDIAPELRPRRDPRPGDVVSAAGPIQRGSVGQRQLHALRVAFSAR